MNVRIPYKTGKSYLRTLVWLIKDGLQYSFMHSIFVVISNFIGVATGVITFSLIVGFIKFQMEGRVISFKGIKLPVPPDGLEGLILYGMLSLIAGLLSAFLIFLSKWGTIRICRNFQTQCIIKSIERLIINVPYTYSKLNFFSQKHDIEHIPTIYCRFVAFSYRFVLDATLPLITLIFTSAVLLYLDVFVTFSLIPLIIFFSIPIYRLNRQSSKVQSLLLSAMDVFLKWTKNITTQLSINDNPFIKKDIKKILLDDSELNLMTKYLYEPIQLKFNADFFSRSLIITCMIWLFIIFGFQVLNQERSWVSVLTYIVSLKYLGSSLQQVSSSFVNISRFYPAVIIYKKFLEKNVENEINSKTEIDLLNLRFLTRDSLPFHTKDKLSIEKGKPILLLNPFEIDSRKLLLILKKSFGPENYGAIKNRTLSNLLDAPINNLSILQNILGSNEEESKLILLKKKFKELGVLDEIRQLPNGFHALYNDSIDKKIRYDTKFCICNGFFLFFNNKFIFMNEGNFNQFDISFQTKFLNQIKSNIIFMISCWSGDFQEFNSENQTFENVLISDGEKIVGTLKFKDIPSEKDKINSFFNEINRKRDESIQNGKRQLSDIELEDEF